jgi:mevalonate kinase
MAAVTKHGMREGKQMDQWREFLRPADWEVVVRAPGNFFLSGEHAVMFGHPAVCQPLPMYFYVGLRRRLDDERVNVDSDNVYFVDVLDPTAKRREFRVPHRVISCQLERLLASQGWGSLDIGLYSELPSMCGLASSGALAASLAIALHCLFDDEQGRAQLESFLKAVRRPERTLSSLAQTGTFARRLFPLAWRIDSLFHNHASSGANAFFSLVGSPDGLPGWYRQTKPRRGSIDEPVLGCNPSRTFSRTALCPHFGNSPRPDMECHTADFCPDFRSAYACYDAFPFEAKSMAEDFPGAVYDTFHFCCALTFSGKAKMTELAIKSAGERIELFGAYLSSLSNIELTRGDAHDLVMAYIGSLSPELWATMGEYFDSPTEHVAAAVLEKINYVQSALANLLGISNEQIDEICNLARVDGLAGKLTGGGMGGDVLLVAKGDHSTRLHRLIGRLEGRKSREYQVHYEGRWHLRQLASQPEVVVPEDWHSRALRWLLIMDVVRSEDWRSREGDESFTKFSQLVDSIANGCQGRVLPYSRTNDERFVALAGKQDCHQYKQLINQRLKADLGKECRIAYVETPIDWAQVPSLDDATAEESHWIARAAHELKAKS